MSGSSSSRQFWRPEEENPTGNRIFSIKLVIKFICQFPCPKCMAQEMLHFYSETSYATSVSHFKFRCGICTTEFTLNDSGVEDEPHKQRMISRNKFLVVANALASKIGITDTNTQLTNLEMPTIGPDVWRRCTRMWQKTIKEQEQQKTQNEQEKIVNESQIETDVNNTNNSNNTAHQNQASQSTQLNLSNHQSNQSLTLSNEQRIAKRIAPTTGPQSIDDTTHSESSTPTSDFVNLPADLSQKQHDSVVCIPDIEFAQVTAQIKQEEDHETTDGESYLYDNNVEMNEDTDYGEIERRDVEEDEKKNEKVKLEQSVSLLTKIVQHVKQEFENVETHTEGISSVSNTHNDTLQNQSLKEYETPIIYNENMYECPECDYKCKLPYYLKIHMKTCVVKKLYDCVECEYKCSKRSEMDIHMMIHRGEEPYTCSECGYKCVHPFYLKRHMRTHTGEKPFACTFCEYKFSQKCHLKRHMRIHT